MSGNAVADGFLPTSHHPSQQTVSPYPTTSRSPSPLMRPTYAAASCSSSDTSPRDSMMLSGAQQPSIHRIQQIMEDYFSSDTNSSDAEENLETVLSAVLRDPLESCMEGIEDLATGILRTGKLSVQGEAGDMSKLQPILLGLQASEREIAQLLPQIMQVPFFDQVETDNRSWGWSSNGHGLVPEDFLACGHIRLGLPIDTAIYHLLNRHCAKGARQAEEVIQSSQTIEYVKSLGNHLIPALICSATVLSSPSPPLHENRFPVENFLTADRDDEMCLPLCNGHGHRQSKRHNSTDSGVLSDHATAEGHLNHLQPPRAFSKSRDVSYSSLATCESKSDCQSSHASSASLSYSPMSSTSALPMVHSQSGGDIGGGGDRIKTIVEEVPNREAESRDVTSSSPPRSSHRRRKMSQIHRPSLTSISGSEISDDGTSGNSSIMKGRLIFDRNQWNTTVVDNNMIVAMYGDTTYPLLMWNPKLKLDFEISSSAGVPGMIVAVDPSTPSLNIRLHNPTSHRIAFSIRAYRQTSVHDSHIIYPLNGLHVLEHSQCWEENADIHLDSPDKNEYVIVELFFATLEANKPCWNVVRKYAVMKAKKRRQSKEKPARSTSHFQMPGTAEKKHDNLKQVIAHGLQCVVKNKHSAAEIIFTQALFLPDFQRIELKAFVYICLAVVAYRRHKAGEIESLTHAMTLVNSVDKLIDACEAPRTIRMPRTVHLVKQLRKELNFSDIVKNMRKKDHRHKHKKLESHYHSEGSTTLICEQGGYLTHRHTSLLVPQGALESQTEVTLASPDHKQLQAMLASTGWEKMVRIICAVHVECSPSVGCRFQEAVMLKAKFPGHVKGLQSLPLLLHSSYLRQWEDITQDPLSNVSVSEGVVDVTTDRTGWIAVAIVDIDPVRIASMAMQSLSIAPMTLQVCVFGQRFPDDIMQITVLMSPAKEGEDQGDPTTSEYKGSIDHTQISFPYLIQAYPGEQLRCRLRGNFEPDTHSSETDLDFLFKATQAHECLSSKFIHLTTPFAKCRGGKLVTSRYLSATKRWEDIADISVHISSGSRSRHNSSAERQS